MIPFAAFKFSDADFARMNTGDARPIQEMIEKISVHLNELVNANALESWERTNLWHYFNEVFSCLASKYSNIMKGVDQVMKHKLFVTEVDRIRQASIEQGQNDIWGAIDYLYLHGRENEIQTITKDKELRKQIVAEYKTAMQAQQVSG